MRLCQKEAFNQRYVDDKNIGDLSKIENIDGFLIGGASLKPEVFGKIIGHFQN